MPLPGSLPNGPQIDLTKLQDQEYVQEFCKNYGTYISKAQATYQEAITVVKDLDTKYRSLGETHQKLKDYADNLKKSYDTLKTERDRLQELVDNAGATESDMTTFKVRPFSGEKGDDDWSSWRANFKMVCIGNGWNDKTAKAAAYIAMKGRAARATRAIVLPETATRDELLNRFEKVFLPESATAYALSQFQLAAQEEGESSLDWHTRIGDLYARAYPTKTDSETSDELILRFCHGFRDRSLVFRLYNPKPKSFSEALQKAQADEASRHIATGGANGSIHGTSKKVASLGEVEELLAALGVQPTCWYCSEKGHIKAECPKRKRDLANRRARGGGRQLQSGSSRPLPTYNNAQKKLRTFFSTARNQINALEEQAMLESEGVNSIEDVEVDEENFDESGEELASVEEAEN